MFKVAGDSEADVDRGEVFVPRGGVLMIEVHAVAESSGSDYEGWETLSLSSNDTRVAEVRPSIVSDSWVIMSAEDRDFLKLTAHARSPLCVCRYTRLRIVADP